MRFDWGKFWDILSWVAFAYLLVYLLLKVLGILNSPPAADVVAITSMGVFIGRHVQKIDHIEKDMHELKNKMHRVERYIPQAFEE